MNASRTRCSPTRRVFLVAQHAAQLESGEAIAVFGKVMLEAPLPISVVVRFAGSLGNLFIDGAGPFGFPLRRRRDNGRLIRLIGRFCGPRLAFRFQVLQAEKDIRGQVDELDAGVVFLRPAQRLVFGAVTRQRIDERAHRQGVGVGENGDRRLRIFARDVGNERGGVGQPFDEYSLGTHAVEELAQVPSSRRRQVADAEDVNVPGVHALCSAQAL
jgi:hypothetical protein